MGNYSGFQISHPMVRYGVRPDVRGIGLPCNTIGLVREPSGVKVSATGTASVRYMRREPPGSSLTNNRAPRESYVGTR